MASAPEVTHVPDAQTHGQALPAQAVTVVLVGRKSSVPATAPLRRPWLFRSALSLGLICRVPVNSPIPNPLDVIGVTDSARTWMVPWRGTRLPHAAVRTPASLARASRF